MHWRHCQPQKAIETYKICASLFPFLSVKTIKTIRNILLITIKNFVNIYTTQKIISPLTIQFFFIMQMCYFINYS